MALDEFLGFIERLEAFDSHAELLAIVENNSYELEKLQRAQLAQGIDITGNPRIDYYTEPYAKQKQKKYTGLGADISKVTFYATGDLYESLKTEVSDAGFIVNAPTDKFDFMTNRIGDENYGLAPAGCLVFATEITLPQTLEAFQKKVIE